MVDTNETTMGRRAVLAGAAGGIAALAGCSGSADDADEPTETTTETTTTAPTTEPAPSLEDLELPMGVSEESVSANLLAVHERAVADVSQTIDVTRLEHGDLLERTVRYEDGRFLQTEVGRGPQQDIWNEDGEGYIRVAGGETYFQGPQEASLAELSRLHRMEDQLRAGDYQPVEAVEEDGQTLIVAEATEATLTDRLAHQYESIESYTGRLTFTPEGRIAEFDVEFEYVDPERGSGMTEWTFRVHSVGETTVAAPDWVSIAREDGFDFDVAPGEDGSFVRVDVSGGDGGTHPNLHVSYGMAGRRRGSAGLDRSLTDGDTLYLGFDENDESVVTVNEPPEAVQDVSGPVDVSLYVNGPEVIDTRVSL
ncbi:Uncharacterized protein HSRCO_0667 [Halanaeroarchaeum sp. HSR-CO]|uniref:hypothetical protein n=1 Tax=Halanaeroarchaeum sp. HSR-CO TaxID=2866382 RepID=UPI00217E5250|nr:hypothetical protein [Halanaeroarchaeum sp. HSR-CO]UWG46962.1 Uncharacterized protein HSRCO_0667 [Halanaeroarchaeum sp. HSR-CO]